MAQARDGREGWIAYLEGQGDLVSKLLGWPLGYVTICPTWFHKDLIYSEYTNVYQRVPNANQDQ